DSIYERILKGNLCADQRIPSVREYGAEIGVNPNTVMRAYEKLTEEGVIYNKRGIGYFICPDARQIVLEKEREYFLSKELPLIRQKMTLLGIDFDVLKNFS
ncbi:MAG: GntR family transcriptional regulator, partial [Candidatus Cryptobacteroides sp.]